LQAPEKERGDPEKVWLLLAIQADIPLSNNNIFGCGFYNVSSLLIIHIVVFRIIIDIE